MYERTYGNKVEETRSLNTTEIAKRFRQDVKAAKKAGKLPKTLKLSVRTSYFSMGSSIDVTIKHAGVAIVTRDYIEEWARKGSRPFGYDCRSEYFTDEAKAVKDTLEALLGSYNWDGSETQVDYFDVRFYGHVKFDHDLTAEAEVAEALAMGFARVAQTPLKKALRAIFTAPAQNNNQDAPQTDQEAAQDAEGDQDDLTPSQATQAPQKAQDTQEAFQTTTTTTAQVAVVWAN
jgi:hypothetical protein